jgi:transposase InsO family protein
MRYTQSEKMEIIRLVETSDLPVKRTLEELSIPRSTFYRWYKRYQVAGYDGLADQKPGPQQIWNRIPDVVRQQVVELALEYPDKSPRELAWFFTDTEGYFVSESSTYRILKAFDLITSPVFQVVTASDKFKNPTKRVNELWQTDFTQFKVIGWGWYYLCTVLDDYSRYILAWRLAPTMASTDVEQTLDIALARTGVTQVKVEHRPRLLSDNGPSFISQALAQYLKQHKLKHVRGAPYHPQTQGKIERYHRSMKSIVKLDNYYYPWVLEEAIANFVEYYNHHRYHESLDNLTPADMFFGRAEQILTQREEVKRRTLQERRNHHFQQMLALA